MFKKPVLVMLFVALTGASAFADNYSAIGNLPISASNMIIQNMRTGYQTRDYDLFRASAQRAIDLKLKGSLIVFKEVFSGSDPTVHISQPQEVARLQPFYRYSALGLGAFGGESEAETLNAALLDNTDNQNLFYLIRALGMMKGVQAALDALNGYALQIDDVLLAKELLKALASLNSRSSLNSLRTMMLKPRFAVINSEISNTIKTLETSGE